MTPELQTVLGWVIGLIILSLCFLIACIVTAQPIDDTHPDALGSLDQRDGIGQALAESKDHERWRDDRHLRTTT
ncbi:hypothetical protein [Microbacterium sp. SORGH_AS_0862]|uniref:hypothetical protein n=1 Tax=Microbacterium sp. SORGH_AS_0862 TaxID=3041789 RepID=UPI00278EABC4|nr:hypothetical protein [Microbacterium sp. SORGH_AS_0862]MDQ1206176.1 hypothetical protein [Microbacterium sp. SORGH_AS_0862]